MWRTASLGCSVEVRIQEHQVDRPHPPDNDAAADYLEQRVERGVWILRQCEPGSRTSGTFAGTRKTLAAKHYEDTAIQRICGGRIPVSRTGPPRELLSRTRHFDVERN